MSKIAKFVSWLSTEKALFYTGCLVFIVYFSLLVNFQQSRWLYTDSAFTFFRILNKEPLFFDRFANFIQVLPAQLAVNLKLPASAVLILLNWTLPLLFLIAFLIFNNLRTGFSFVFPLFLFIAGPQFFFLGYNEILTAVFALGLSINFVFLKNKKIAVPGFILAQCTMLFAHPASLIFVPLIFLLCLHDKKTNLALLSLLPVLLFISKSVFLGFNEYDQNLLNTFINTSAITGIFSAYSWFYFKSTTYTWMLPSLLTLAVTTFVLIKTKIKKITLILWSYILICLIVLLLIYHSGDATINMEKFFYPFSVICVLSLCFIANKIEFRNLIAVFIFFISCGFSIKSIIKESHFYTSRFVNIHKLENYYSQKQNYKIMLADTLLPNEEFGSTWGLPYETMLISALNSHKNSVTVQTGKGPVSIVDSLYLAAGFELPRRILKLNPVYFHLPLSAYFIDTVNHFKK